MIAFEKVFGRAVRFVTVWHWLLAAKNIPKIILFKWYCPPWSEQLYFRHKVLAPQLPGTISALSKWKGRDFHTLCPCVVSLFNIKLNGEGPLSLSTVCGVYRNQMKSKLDARTAIPFFIWETLCAAAKRSVNWKNHIAVLGFEQQPHALPPVLCGCKSCNFEIISATSFVGVDYMLADEWSLECGTCISAG